MIRFGLRLAARRRPGGARPAGRHRRRRRARRRAAADHPGRRQRGQRAERPVRLAATPAPSTPAPPTPDPLWWSPRSDYFHGEPIGRVDVAATGPDSPVPPGIPRLPGPGRVLRLARACRRCCRATPADQLGDRFPGREVGTIGPAALPSPDSLLVVVGRTPAELAGAAATVAGSVTSRRRLRRGCSSASTATASTSSCRVVAGGAAVPGADLHRHRDPAVRGPPGAALRRDAAGRRDAPADLGGRRGRGDRRRRRRHRRRVRAVLRCSAARVAGDPVHRHAVLPRRPVARRRSTSCWSRSASRRGRGRGPARAAPGAGSRRWASPAGSRRGRRGRTG